MDDDTNKFRFSSNFSSRSSQDNVMELLDRIRIRSAPTNINIGVSADTLFPCICVHFKKYVYLLFSEKSFMYNFSSLVQNVRRSNLIFRDFTEELMFLKINRYTKINSVIFVLRLFLRIMIQMFLIKKNYIYRICNCE